MVAFSITHHACERFIERVDGTCTIAQARAAIRSHARAIEAAIGIGCKCVRLGEGHRIIVDYHLAQVVTVLPAMPKVHSIQHSGRGLDFSASKRQARFGETENVD